MNNFRFCYQQMCKSLDGGWTTMAAMLGRSVNALESKVYERGGQSMDVELAMQMQKASKTTYFAEAVAAESGGVFVPNPQRDVYNVDIPILYMKLIEEIGALANEWRLATADGELNSREQQKLELIRQRICQDVTMIHLMTVELFTKKKE